MLLKVAVGSLSIETFGLEEDDAVSGDSGRNMVLIQRLLSKATHPSPIKAMFKVEELEAAALDVSQYLASAAAAKKVNLGSPVAEEAAGTTSCVDDEEQPEISNDAAAARPQQAETGRKVAAQQYVTGEAVTSRDLRMSHRRRRNRARRQQQQQHQSTVAASASRLPSPPPPTATVSQLVEMGFPRAAVERAVKAIDGGVGELGPSPESIVAWLLEHPDQVETEAAEASLSRNSAATSRTSDVDDDGSESEDSFSDSFEDIDASGASEQAPLGVAVACVPPPEAYKRRCDFASNDEYAYYVRERLQMGMTVRCCRTYEEVHDGDVGRQVILMFF